MKTKYTISRFDDITPRDFGLAATKAEKDLAQQMAHDTEEFVPALTGAFYQNTRVINNLIIYQGPQVGYLYEGHKMVDAVTGKGPRVIPGVGPRWRRYQVLKPTSEPLTYTKSPHPKATDHWMEASEKQNANKWAKFAEEAIANGL